MTTEGTSEEGQESGGALRDRLEEEIAEKRALREALAAEVAERFQYVKPEDLGDVAPGELRDRAAQIEEQRAAERAEVLKAELAARGMDEKQIEEFIGAKPQATPPPATSQPKFDGNIGTPPARPKPGEGEGVYGPSRIRAAMG